MTTKKMNLWLITILLLTTVFAGAVTMQVMAAQTFTTTSGCKDMVNDGIEFKTSVGIVDPVTEDFRDRIQVTILNPSNTDYHTPNSDNVLSVALYAASDGTEYQCQQLTSDGIDNSFSCNSFPAGGTISSVHVTFIPDFIGSPATVVTGDYTINITEIDTSDVLLSGTANIDATSTACAQNQGTATFSPVSGETAFIYSTCATTPLLTQDIKFDESTTSPFTIVSFPLGESIDPDRLKLLVTPETDAFDYTFTLNFEDSAHTPMTMIYTYTGGTASVDYSSYGGTWTTNVPIKLIGGDVSITTTNWNLLPTQTDFELTFYYQNDDPTLGYENSMFHFVRNMSVQFSNYCTGAGNENYAVSSTSYDSCKATSQSFSLSFLDSSGAGMDVSTSEVGVAGWIEDKPDGTRPASRDVYFMTRRCSDATCTTYPDSGSSYVSSVTVSDGWATETTYGTTATSLNTLSKIPMYLFSNGTAHPFTFRKLTLVATAPGTYVISAFKTGATSSMVAPLLYITIPQYDSDLSCYTPGNAGRFEAEWDGCNEDFDTELIEFTAVDEAYAFISNYSNKTVTFTLDPSISNMPTTVDMKELYCEWQILADGYSSSGGSCGNQKIVVPPYTRAIVTGGKFYLYEKPKINDTDEYLISYRRSDTGNDMTLIMDLSIKECKQEKIPDTGYSLRSPQKMTGASKSDIIFTGNSIQIPAIGLGMETPIPIVHVYYIGESFDNGWDLTMLGGYVGELEGGAYIPYSGNAVLTGHYYSQGVFVNLTGLHLEDEIIVYATDGMKYVYKVNNSFYTKPSDVYQLFQPNGEKSLTIVTCDSYNLITDEYENRYVVMATLDHAEPYEQ